MELLLRESLQPFSHRMYCSVFSLEHKQQTCTMAMRSNVRMISATVAFGTGLNVSTIGAVVFYGLPKEFDGFEQMIGRAHTQLGNIPVVIASDGKSNAKLSAPMKTLVGYVPATKSKKTICCADCGASHALPETKGALVDYKRCLDFGGITCQCPTRRVCLCTFCMYLSSTVDMKALDDASLDCHSCLHCVTAPITVLSDRCRVKYGTRITGIYTAPEQKRSHGRRAAVVRVFCLFD